MREDDAAEAAEVCMEGVKAAEYGAGQLEGGRVRELHLTYGVNLIVFRPFPRCSVQWLS